MEIVAQPGIDRNEEMSIVRLIEEEGLCGTKGAQIDDGHKELRTIRENLGRLAAVLLPDPVSGRRVR